MRIKDLGEFGVIELLQQMVVGQRRAPDRASSAFSKLLVDNGDDAAAWCTEGATQLFTTDTMVEGVHFQRDTTPWRDLGWKSLASNISDIAAMGGQPLYALITLGLPPDTEVDDIKELYGGMLEISNTHGAAIVGGDMVRSPVVFITVSLTGVLSGIPLLRSTACVGDQVAVTGFLGASAGGLRLLMEGGTASPEAAEYLRQCHRLPQPAVAEGRILSEAGVVTAMDISDGLADDLGKLCRASGISARLTTGRIPMHPLLRQVFPQDCLDLALYGGEDYLLLFTADSARMSRVMPLLPEGAATIGEITSGTPGQVLLVDASGAETVAGPGGWDHYK
jgi:thiamine-monophosphate kinase